MAINKDEKSRRGNSVLAKYLLQHGRQSLVQLLRRLLTWPVAWATMAASRLPHACQKHFRQALQSRIVNFLLEAMQRAYARAAAALRVAATQQPSAELQGIRVAAESCQKATGAALPSAAWLRAQAGQQDSPAGVSAIDSIAIDAALGGPRIAASQMQPMFCMSPVKAPQSAHISAISSNLRHSSTLPLGKLETVAEEGTGESGYVMDQSLVPTPDRQAGNQERWFSASWWIPKDAAPGTAVEAPATEHSCPQMHCSRHVTFSSPVKEQSSVLSDISNRQTSPSRKGHSKLPMVKMPSEAHTL